MNIVKPPNLGNMMPTFLKTLLATACLALTGYASAQITLYEHDGFQGRSFTTEQKVGDLQRFGFNDLASSVIVTNDRWEVCDDVRFGGRCVVLRPGQYSSLSDLSLNDRISSVRIVNRDSAVTDDRYPPALALPIYDNRRRANESMFEAQVTGSRAVVSTPTQRCWVEREQVNNDRGGANVGGAIVGGLIGGILGHQVGGGFGKDLATAGGLATGAAIGANSGRDRQTGYAQDVQRCASNNDGRPTYWDVTYAFRGIDHRIQMTSPPGPTVTVNRRGEPRS